MTELIHFLCKVEEIMKLTYTVTLHRHVVEQAVPEQQSLNVDDMV